MTASRTGPNLAAKVAHTLLAFGVLLSLQGAGLASCLQKSAPACHASAREASPHDGMRKAHGGCHAPAAAPLAFPPRIQGAPACVSHTPCCEIREPRPTRRSPAADLATASAGSTRVPPALLRDSRSGHAAWTVAGVRFVKPVSDRKTDLRI